jgi:hypothetical protein
VDRAAPHPDAEPPIDGGELAMDVIGDPTPLDATPTSATLPPPTGAAPATAVTAVTALTPVPPPGAPWDELRGLRGGELTAGWRVAFAAGWLAVFFGFAAIWKTSVELGLSTWWLGPAAQPRPLFVQLLPFAAPTAMVVGALSGWRFLPWAGLAAAAVSAAIALGEFAEFARFGGLELLLALAGALVSIGALAGTYRRS